jgi:hypothetical protein
MTAPRPAHYRSLVTCAWAVGAVLALTGVLLLAGGASGTITWRDAGTLAAMFVPSLMIVLGALVGIIIFERRYQ